MKLLLCFGALAALSAFALAYSKGQVADFRKVAENCFESNGVKIEDVNKAQKKEYVDNPKMANYVYCMFTGLGLVDRAGKMVPDMYREMAPEIMDADDVEERIKKCENEKGSSPQNTAYAVFRCMKLGPNATG